jgi:hypothetical protein
MTITPAPGPTSPKRGRGRTVLIVVAVVAVVCCGGSVAAGWALYKGVGAATGPPHDAGDKFLSDLESGNTSGAYGLLCESERGHLSQDSFTSLIAAQPRLRSHKIVSTSVRSVNGNAGALVVADLHRDSGSVDRHSIQLFREGGAWHVCGDPY